MNDFSLIQSQLTSVWPEWKITRRLGKGSFGYVYEILRDDLGNRYTCAMKVLQMVSEESDPSLEEFVRGVSREINMMMQLKGAPNIVTIEDYAVLRSQGTRTILIRMEELESVETLRARQGGLDRRNILQMGLDICTALISCERQNIIHRDIKLSNIFFSDKGGYKLGDFGISRTMDTIHERMSMSSAGTIQYMAPEVYFGYRYGNTADIYSLGIALYILLNGNLPPLCNEYNMPLEQIPMSMLHEANMRRLRGTRFPRPAYADERLGNVICVACDPDPARRFRTAEQFREALLSCTDPRAAVSPGKKQRAVGGARVSGTSYDAPVYGQDGGGTSPGKRALIIGLLIALLASLACAVFFIAGNHPKTSNNDQIAQEESNGENAVSSLPQSEENEQTAEEEPTEGKADEENSVSNSQGPVSVTEGASETFPYTDFNTDLDDSSYPEAVAEEAEEEAPDVDIPSSGTLLYNGHTYYAYGSSSIDSFYEAEAYCESLGGYLAVINNDAENTALYDYVFYNCGLESSYFGLTDENVEGSWEWVDGTPYSYENWLDGQPDNLREVENYALFYYKDSPYKWNDGDFGKDAKTGKVFFLIEWDVQL